MAKHFGAQHTGSAYSAMGNAIGKPILARKKYRTVSDSIAAARRAAEMERRLASKKKK